MAFDKEPSGYKKTVHSDLQGAWRNLRDSVVEHAGFAGWKRALLHIDEAMSWESVRNLRYMSKCLLRVRNILARADVPGEVALWGEEVNRVMDEALQALREGEIDWAALSGLIALATSALQYYRLLIRQICLFLPGLPQSAGWVIDWRSVMVGRCQGLAGALVADGSFEQLLHRT